jgi:adenylylsulfate kinase
MCPTGFTLWLTGLPCAGKSTIAGIVVDELEGRGLLVETLDGEDARKHLSPDLGFSKADREVHNTRVAHRASGLARAGAAVVVSVIAPYERGRGAARSLHVESGVAFVEVHVATPLSECIRRDAKGLYRRALAGELRDFTGVDAPYEVPRDPELRIDTTGQTPFDSAALVLERLATLIPSSARRELGT